MGMESILQKLKKSFTPRKMIDFPEAGLHVELEPLVATDEVKVTESLKGIEDRLYIDALKRHSLACSIRKIIVTEEGQEPTVFDLSNEFVEYLNDAGEQKTKSRFLYMLDFLGKWPNAVIDVLFEAFTNMHQEIEAKVRKQSKFEVFRISEEPEEDKEPKLRPVIETEEDKEALAEMTDTERLERKVKREIEEADIKIQNS